MLITKQRTKIICTLGPATDDDSILTEMIKSGMNVARLNMSHGTHEEHKARIDRIKKLRNKLNIPIAILVDTKGPEIRIRTFKNGKVNLKEKQKFTLTPTEIEGDETKVSFSYRNLYKFVKKGQVILLNDGEIELNVEEIKGEDIITIVKQGGELSNRKSINVPNVSIDMKYLSDQDKSDLKFAIDQDADFLALSFVRRKQDVLDVYDFLKENNGKNICCISKIENREGVNNIKDIIDISYGIMVARGDMGVEIPFEELPYIQKNIINMCNQAGKVVITATQMLESMIHNMRPTRAEISDVANAVYDGTSATMLSAESSVGKYPVQTVATMRKIIEEAEKNFEYLAKCKSDKIKNITDAISHAAVQSANDLKAKLIIACTKSGATAREISKFHPSVPIIAATSERKIYYQLILSWGTYPLQCEDNNIEKLIEQILNIIKSQNEAKKGDIVIITAGIPAGMGNSNLLKIINVN